MPDVEEEYLEQVFSAHTVAGKMCWPLTIMRSRYGGTYENGGWVAFNCHPHQIPTDAYGDDVTCANFWWSGQSADVGRGETPNKAIADLIKRLSRAA